MTDSPSQPDSDRQPQEDDPVPSGPSPDQPLADVPPVAGGTDDSPPAQGEGEDDSW